MFSFLYKLGLTDVVWSIPVGKAVSGYNELQEWVSRLH